MPPPPGTASRRWQPHIRERMAPLFLGSRCWGSRPGHTEGPFPGPVPVCVTLAGLWRLLVASHWPPRPGRWRPPRLFSRGLASQPLEVRPPHQAPRGDSRQPPASLARVNTSHAQTGTPSFSWGIALGTLPPSPRAAPPSSGRQPPEGGVGHHRWARRELRRLAWRGRHFHWPAEGRRPHLCRSPEICKMRDAGPRASQARPDPCTPHSVSHKNYG